MAKGASSYEYFKKSAKKHLLIQISFALLVMLLTFGSLQAQVTVATAIKQLQDSIAEGTDCKLPDYTYASLDDSKFNRRGRPVDRDAIVNQLISKLGLSSDRDKPANVYQGFVTRLFDTPSKNDSFYALADSELLGITGSDFEANSMFLWKTSATTIKYDCTALLSLAVDANAGSGSFLPIITLNGSFNASRNPSARGTVILVVGTAQSPFDYFFWETSDHRQLFAGLRAIQWYQLPLVKNMPDTEKRLTYLKKASVISFTSNLNDSSGSSIAATLKANASIKLIGSIKGDLAYNLAREYERVASRFTTYFYDSSITQFPPIELLTARVQQDIPMFALSPPAVFPATPFAAKKDVIGWPADLCKPGVWTVSSDESKLEIKGATWTPAKPSEDGFPVCSISISAQPNAGVVAGSFDPRFKLTLNADKNVKLTIPVTTDLSVLNSPKFIPTQAGLRMKPVVNPASPGQPAAQVLWKINGQVQIPSGFSVDRYEIDAAPLHCQSDSVDTPLQASFSKVYDSEPVYFSAPDHTLRASSLDLTIIAGLGLGGAKNYNINAPSSANRTCDLRGVLHIWLNEPGVPARDFASEFTVKGIQFPPERSATALKSWDCGIEIQDGSIRLVDVAGKGFSCSLAGSDMDLASELILKAGADKIKVRLTPGKDSGSAIANFAADDVNKLTRHSRYQIYVADDYGTETPENMSFGVVPLPSITSPGISISELRAARGVLHLGGSNLGQITSVRLVNPSTGLTAAVGRWTKIDDSTGQADFPLIDLNNATATSFKLVLVVNSSTNQIFDPQITL